jgi:hypothetical protein
LTVVGWQWGGSTVAWVVLAVVDSGWAAVAWFDSGWVAVAWFDSG